MNRTRLTGALLAALTVAGLPGTALASGADHGRDDDDTFVLAVTGDIPYGAAQLTTYPGVIDDLNADPDVDMVIHLGDIKAGSGLCSNDYFSQIRAQFDRLEDPLVYTPGDNEWTDCHRVNNGAYNPLERLAAIRSTFFPRANRTLGLNPVRVSSQARIGFPENVRFERADVELAAVHVVGSNNSLAPWSGLGLTTPTAEQVAEVQARTAADLKLIRETFRDARREHAPAVVLMLQADMFDPFFAALSPSVASGLAPIVQAIAAESLKFDGEVLLLNGDSHVLTQDNPLAAGSSWLAFYGLTTPVPNVSRITVEGSDTVDEWLKVTITETDDDRDDDDHDDDHDHDHDDDDHQGSVFTIERIPFTP